MALTCNLALNKPPTMP